MKVSKLSVESSIMVNFGQVPLSSQRTGAFHKRSLALMNAGNSSVIVIPSCKRGTQLDSQTLEAMTTYTLDLYCLLSFRDGELFYS